MTTFAKDFDELLNGILTDYRNQFPGIDTAQGSLVFIKSACLASALWGIYQYQEHIARQIFPDTADTASLEHHAWVRGLSRVAGESDAELLARLLSVIRRPPAGGNRYDYERWALEIDNVAQSWCFPLAQGDGTVDVVILADPATGSEIPDQDLLDEVLAYIDEVRPVTHSQIRVLAPTVDTQAVTMTVAGEAVNLDAVTAEITAHLDAMEPGQPLYRSKLASIAIELGAVNATVTVPAADVTPAGYHMIRAGAVNVTDA